MKELSVLLFLSLAVSAIGDTSVSGHIKSQYQYRSYPENSFYRDIVGANTQEGFGDARLKFSSHISSWSFQADYQLTARFAEALGTQATGVVLEDDSRLWDLTHTISESKHRVVQQRLDRLYVDYIGEKTVARLGRQVVSWGNGLMFSPMDFFNPFDPTAVDKEYKTGDDMLYGQYLNDNGNDFQAVWVWRRDIESGSVDNELSSQALKYHAFVGTSEIDILVASHFQDEVLGLGMAKDVAGAVVRGDLTWTHLDDEDIFSLVGNVTYSWEALGKNMTGALEYYYNGFGITDGDYSPERLRIKSALVERITRGELYTLARQYIATTLTVELTPLFTLNSNVFFNINDSSAIFQTVGQYMRWQNIQLLFSLNLPIGGDGTEYGGIESPVEGKYFSVSSGAMLQIAWYF